MGSTDSVLESQTPDLDRGQKLVVCRLNLARFWLTSPPPFNVNLLPTFKIRKNSHGTRFPPQRSWHCHRKSQGTCSLLSLTAEPLLPALRPWP